MTNPLTNGQPSGAGENSSSPTQTFQAQQDAMHQAQRAKLAAAQQAVEVANAAARNRPSSSKPSGLEQTGNISTNAHGNPPVGLPKKGKGK
jgi:ribosomal protein L4